MICECVVAVLLGGGPPGSVPVTRCDSLTIWPLWRALGMTCPSWLPAPAWLTSWPDRMPRTAILYARSNRRENLDRQVRELEDW